MITLSRPVQLAAPIALRRIQSILPTTLSTEEIEAISSDILRRSFFSARTYLGEYVQEIYDIVSDYETGKLDQATAILKMKNALDQTGYSPGDKAGTIEDLGSDSRRLLILKTQADFGAGFGYYKQAQDRLDTWPAQELVRVGPRKTHRNWTGDDGDIKGEPPEGRWKAAGGKFFEDRMIALVNDPIWEAISHFDLPYPPFDFNSGMGVRGISRAEAIKVGIISPNSAVQQPKERNFNDDLEVTADVRAAALREALLEAGYEFDGDVLTLGESL